MMVFTLRHPFDFIDDDFDSGLVNVNSFEISGIISYNGYQYVTWYTSSRYAMIGRRQLGATNWSVVQLNHQLSTSDSHNVVVVGISKNDGK